MTRSIFIISLLFCVGCGPLTAPVSPGDDKKPSGPTKETHWTCIAEEVEADEISDSDQLILIVDRLRARSKLTDADIEKFDTAFPKFRGEGGRRDLTKSDAQTLRGL